MTGPTLQRRRSRTEPVTDWIVDHIWPLGLGAFAVALAGGITWLIIALGDEHARRAAWCERENGHVIDSTATTVTVGAKGQPGVGVSTTYYCLSADGRLLDVWSY